MIIETIRTSRLLLRPWKASDAPQMYAYASEPGWSPYNPIPNPYTEREAEMYVASQIIMDRSKTDTWAIERDGSLIGGAEFRWLAGGMIGNLGYAIARTHSNQGYATEAIAAIVKTAYEQTPKLQRINASLHHKNQASARVLEKCGFVREGILRKNTCMYGELADQVWYGLMRDEWEAMRENK